MASRYLLAFSAEADSAKQGREGGKTGKNKFNKKIPSRLPFGRRRLAKDDAVLPAI